MVLYIIGLVSGLISGMGIGGGTVLIPALVIFVKPEQHIAQSVNLLFFIPTAIIALIVHIKNKLIDFKIAVPIIIAGLAGTYIGSKIAFSFKAPILITMSTSVAPFSMASCTSEVLVVMVLAPKGKPITVVMPTLLSCNKCFAIGT